MTNKDALLELMRNDKNRLIVMMTSDSCGTCPAMITCDIRRRNTYTCACAFREWLDKQAGLSEEDKKDLQDTIEKVMNEKSDTNDVVNHPAYYTDGIETSDYIASHNLDFFRGNIIKYVTRAGKKSTDTYKQDLEKARWYLNYLIEHVDGENDDD